MNGVRVAAALLAAASCCAAQAGPQAKQTRVEVMAGNQVVTSIAVPPRASVHPKADRMKSGKEGQAVVVRMEGQAQVDVRDGQKLLFSVTADQLVVREDEQEVASGAPPRAPAPVPGATFILG